MKTQLLAVILFCTTFSFGQEISASEEQYLRSLLNEDQSALFDYVARNEFSRIAKNNANGNMGNMVGISTKDDNLSMGYYFVRKNGTFELNASGSITEGAATIFTSQQLNTGASLGVKYNWMFKLSKFKLDLLPAEAIRMKDQELQHKLNLHKASNYTDPTDLKKKLSTKEAELLKAETDIVNFKSGKSEQYFNGDKNKELVHIKDLLIAEIKLIDARIDSLTKNKTLARIELKKKQNPNDPNLVLQRKVDSLKVELLKYELEAAKKEKKEALKKIDAQIKANTVNLATFDTQLKELETKKVRLEQEVETARQTLDQFMNGGAANKFNIDGNAITKEIHDNLLKVKGLKAMDVHMIWLSLGGSLKNESFKLFDRTKSQSDQIYKQQDLIPSASLSVTYYSNESSEGKVGSRHIKYFTAGATLKYGNNLGSLTQLDIVTNDSITSNRYSTKTVKAYEGEFKDNVITSQVFGDYYQYIGNIDNVGFHVRGTVDIGPQAPVTSMRFGLLYSAMSKEDNKAVANFEIFYGLNDLFKNGEERSLFSRNIVGIQTSFPFDFKFKNK